MQGFRRTWRAGVGGGVSLGLALAVCAGPARAQPAAPLPEPAEGGRELTTDRPDTTESPYTVPAGHLQTETTLYGFSRSRRDAFDVTSEASEIGTTNLRIGLTPRLEADAIVQPYGRVTSSDGQSAREGVGDLTLRAKLNLQQPDGARPDRLAFGVLPFIEVPLDRGDGIASDALGGGLILPVDVQLSSTFSLGLNAGVHVVREDSARGYEPQVLLSASLGQDWNERVGIFYEVSAVVNRRDPAGQMVSLNTGATFKVRKTVQLDAGVNVGVTRATDPIGAFVGVSARF